MLAFFTILCCFLFTEKDAKRNALLTILSSSALVLIATVLPLVTCGTTSTLHIREANPRSGVSTRLEKPKYAPTPPPVPELFESVALNSQNSLILIVYLECRQWGGTPDLNKTRVQYQTEQL